MDPFRKLLSLFPKKLPHSKIIQVDSAGKIAFTDIDFPTYVKIDGAVVIRSQKDAVDAPSGGGTVDAEARTAINTIIARLEAHGLISPAGPS